MPSLNSTVAGPNCAVTCDTALSCLAFLRARDGVFVDAKSIRARAALDSDRLLVGQLIELAGDFGYEAQYVHADWNWLRQTVASRL